MPFFPCAEADEVDGLEDTVDPWVENIVGALQTAVADIKQAAAAGAEGGSNSSTSDATTAAAPGAGVEAAVPADAASRPASGASAGAAAAAPLSKEASAAGSTGGAAGGLEAEGGSWWQGSCCLNAQLPDVVFCLVSDNMVQAASSC